MGKYPDRNNLSQRVCCPRTLDKIQKYEIEAITMLSRHEFVDGCLSLEKEEICLKSGWILGKFNFK